MTHLLASPLASLLPESIYAESGLALLILGSLAGLFLLAKGADQLVEGASGAARRLGMPEIVIGATIVSMGTTTPETAVSVAAAWAGQPGLALGNAVGSIICDTALIFGIGALMTRVPADPFLLKRQGWVQFGSAALLAAICYGVRFLQGESAAIPRLAGIFLLLLLGGYMALSVYWGRRHHYATEDLAHETIEETKGDSAAMLAVRFVGGLVVVVLCSEVVIGCVAQIASRLGIPSVVIASTIVAAGTSLPELVIGISSVRRGHPELLLGNVIGADILNVLFVTGAAATAAPLPIVDPAARWPDVFLILHIPTMLIVLGLFRVFIRSAVRKGSFERWHGVPLLGIYAVYLVLNLLQQQ